MVVKSSRISQFDDHSMPLAGSGKRRWWQLPFAAAAGAVVGGAVMLGPSLLPRSDAIAALVFGLGLAAGYGAGLLVGWFVRQFRRRSGPASPVAWWSLGTVGSIAIVWCLWSGKAAQDDLHALMGMPPPTALWYLTTIVAGVAVGAAVVLICRFVRWLFSVVARWLTRITSARAARAVGILAVAVLVVTAINGSLLNAVVWALDVPFRALDESAGAGATQPTSSTVSGGPSSLVSWDSLGNDGRDFVTRSTTMEEIDAFNGGGAVPPIRAYVGLQSADTSQARVELAVDELENLGAFDRAFLAIGTSTGTGTVDNAAVQPLEYMYDGDVATVSMQYSYLPSWLSFLVDQQRSEDAGSALFDAVYAAWLERPAAERPTLVVFGESLGAFGAQAAFSGIQDLTGRASGALFSGPPNASAMWRAYTEQRDAGSPEILPIYQDGTALRWAQVQTDLEAPTQPWGTARALYLQNASDPVVWWSPSLVLSRPDWLDEPRGIDVLPSLRWWPIVTFLQVSTDLIDSQGVPTGHGHVYGANQVWAWASVMHPEGWTEADTTRLYSRLSS